MSVEMVWSYEAAADGESAYVIITSENRVAVWSSFGHYACRYSAPGPDIRRHVCEAARHGTLSDYLAPVAVSKAYRIREARAAEAFIVKHVVPLIEADKSGRVVVFCDFDGVLNGTNTNEGPSPVHPGIFLNPALVARLNALCDRTSADVVLSTSWRHRFHDDGRPVTLDDLRRALNLAGFTGRVIDGTPDLRPYGAGPKDVYTPRGDEIQKWITMHRPAAFVVLDDHAAANVACNFVRTDARVGLTDSDVERAAIILGWRP